MLSNINSDRLDTHTGRYVADRTKNAQTTVTSLVVKDRLLAHNPLGAIYSRYWRKKLHIQDEDEI